MAIKLALPPLVSIKNVFVMVTLQVWLWQLSHDIINKMLGLYLSKDNSNLENKVSTYVFSFEVHVTGHVPWDPIQKDRLKILSVLNILYKEMSAVLCLYAVVQTRVSIYNDT